MKPWRIVVAGMVSLAVAMGIGRFAFTPLLPMMLADGTVNLAGASWLASANYLGYLVGALLCTLQPWIWRRLGNPPPPQGTVLVRGGLVATVLLTLGMVLHWPAIWPILRFAAGVASALVFVYTSGWCLAQLARLNLPTMGALIYTGPGAGIVLSGLAASGMVALHWSAYTGWLIFGVLAAILTAAVWGTFRTGAPAAPTATAATGALPHPGATGPGTEMALLTVAYGLAGFGYIITATFLPVIARQAIPGSPWLDMFWPLFGLGVVLGALVASRIHGVRDLRLLLIACYLIQAVGVATSLISPTLGGFALGSLLLGLPFTAITFFAMQELRRLRPAQAPAYMGLATASYGIGQIVGPPLAAAMLARSRTPGEGFTLSLEIAACALLLGTLIYGLMVRMYPVRT
ncbi:MAG: YbfB/YjiJ family MFS transporter [Rhodoferax sp.]